MAAWDRCNASLRGDSAARSGLLADFLLVRTADRVRRIGVGLPSPSREAREGGAGGDALSDGVGNAGEKSSMTKAESLSVAEATPCKSTAVSVTSGSSGDTN